MTHWIAMRVITDIQIDFVDPGTETVPSTCALSRQGRCSPVRLEGSTLEAAVQCASRYLVFLGTGALYEELLHIHLLDDQLAPLDHVMVGPYDAAKLGGLSLLGANQLSFRFPEDIAWRLTLWDAPRLRWSLWHYPAGVWRPFGQRHHFALERLGQASTRA